MEIFINNAILHILDNDGGNSFFSKEELDIDSDICNEFITKHVKKLLDNPSAKEAIFNPESSVYADIQAFKNGEFYFKEVSTKICQILLDIMTKHVDIPSGDVLVIQFDYKDNAYLAILKLNYKECFTHQIGEQDGSSDNQIVKYRAVLPFDSGKVEEACLIPYNPMVLKILEKPYLVNGESRYYFSELFLDCSPELSKKEAAQIINEITEEISERYYNQDIETIAKVKIALLEEAFEEEGYISLDNIAGKVFGENEEAKNEYVSMAREAGIRKDIYLGEKFTKQQFSTQKFKSNNGIEVKFPAELSDDKNIIEFINNEDGSISILLKNLRRG